jgi:GTP-binding protein HflX
MGPRLYNGGMPKIAVPTEPPRERAFLVGVGVDGAPSLLTPEDSLKELGRLAETAGLKVVGWRTLRVRRPNPKTLLSSGKVTETRDLAEDALADVVIFDEELSPRHQRELEKALGDDLRVIDRTALILDIFAQHAQTREGALQVELAQYEYRLPRLTRAWTHLARQAGGGGGRAGSVGGVGLRGPGETQLEVDRREIGRRIAHLRKDLEGVRAHRSRYRSRRKSASVPTVALVGYTNAGKSTLLNRLAEAEAVTADQLFATLDPMTRRLNLPDGRQTLMTDTVGFIQKLPTTLIAAFRATLEEISEADLLVHVVDLSHPAAEAQAAAVLATLEEIGAGDLPIITALNKIDLIADDPLVAEAVDGYDRAIPVSALTGEGMAALLRAIEDELDRSLVRVDVRLGYEQGGLVARAYQAGVVESVDHDGRAIRLRARLPRELAGEIQRAARPARRTRPAPSSSLGNEPGTG